MTEAEVALAQEKEPKKNKHFSERWLLGSFIAMVSGAVAVVGAASNSVNDRFNDARSEFQTCILDTLIKAAPLGDAEIDAIAEASEKPCLESTGTADILSPVVLDKMLEHSITVYAASLDNDAN